MKLLQDFIVPYVRFVERDGRITIGAVHGTAFFINSSGAFVTARHVVENCAGDIAANGGVSGLVMRKPGDDQHRYLGSITDVTLVDPPYDVAVGVVEKPSKGHFVLGEGVRAWVWDDVYAAGYPATATYQELGHFTVDARGHKGQILRKVNPGHVLMHPHPAVIEVSFSIPKGLSGAPLMLRDQFDADGNSLPFVLLGVCVGNEPSEIVDHYVKEVNDGGRRLEEKVVRIEEYGIVHDLRPLAEWTPACLGGVTFKDAIRPDQD